MMLNNYTHRTYFTLEDAGIGTQQLKTYCKEPDSEVTAEFLRLFEMTYYDNWMLYSDVEVPAWEYPDEPMVDEKQKTAWLKKFGFLQNSTYDKYAKIIEVYNSQKDNLLNKLQSISENRYLDTPQIDLTDPNVSLDKYLNQYATNISRTSNSTDPMEMMLRLKTIQDNYKNIYKDWMDEFLPLFGE